MEGACRREVNESFGLRALRGARGGFTRVVRGLGVAESLMPRPTADQRGRIAGTEKSTPSIMTTSGHILAIYPPGIRVMPTRTKDSCHACSISSHWPPLCQDYSDRDSAELMLWYSLPLDGRWESWPVQSAQRLLTN